MMTWDTPRSRTAAGFQRPAGMAVASEDSDALVNGARAGALPHGSRRVSARAAKAMESDPGAGGPDGKVHDRPLRFEHIYGM